MNKIKVLIQGYAKEIKNGWLASSTVTLIQSNDKNIIVTRDVITKSCLRNWLKLA